MKKIVSDINLIFKYILEFDISKWDFFSLLLVTVMANLINLSQPYFLGRVIDGVTELSKISIVKNLSFMGLFFLFSMYFLYIKNRKMIETVSKMEIDIKERIFTSVLDMPYKNFLENNNGKLLNIIEEDAMVFSNMLSTTINIVVDILGFLITFGVMLFINPLLSIIFVLILPPTSIIYYISGKKLRTRELELKNEHDEYISFITESFKNFKLLKIFNKEADRCDHFTDRLKSIYSIGVKKVMIETGSEIVLQIILFINNILVLVIGMYLIFKGVFTLGSLISFNSYSEKFKQSALNLTKINSSIQNMVVSLERIHEMVKQSGTCMENKKEIQIEIPNVQTISIKNLNYFVGDKHVLKNLNFKFKKGVINIVSGESGSGKTTLFNILSKLITEYSGNVIFDTVNIQNILNEEYRRKICYVTQESLIFSETIANNLRLYNLEITEDEINEVCKKLNLHEFISNLEYGYETYIYKGGETISGGQAQRLCLARAVLTNPDIFIFDEIVSSLDADNVVLITSIIEELAKEKIVIISSHQKLNISSYCAVLEL